MTIKEDRKHAEEAIEIQIDGNSSILFLHELIFTFFKNSDILNMEVYV